MAVAVVGLCPNSERWWLRWWCGRQVPLAMTPGWEKKPGVGVDYTVACAPVFLRLDSESWWLPLLAVVLGCALSLPAADLSV